MSKINNQYQSSGFTSSHFHQCHSKSTLPVVYMALSVCTYVYILSYSHTNSRLQMKHFRGENQLCEDELCAQCSDSQARAELSLAAQTLFWSAERCFRISKLHVEPQTWAAEAHHGLRVEGGNRLFSQTFLTAPHQRPVTNLLSRRPWSAKQRRCWDLLPLDGNILSVSPQIRVLLWSHILTVERRLDSLFIVVTEMHISDALWTLLAF